MDPITNENKTDERIFCLIFESIGFVGTNAGSNSLKETLSEF